MLRFQIFLFISLSLLGNSVTVGGKLELTLYTKQDKYQSPTEFRVYADTQLEAVIDEIKRSNYLCWIKKEACTTYFIVHGHNADSDKQWIIDMKDAFFYKHINNGLINVFTLNWSGNPTYLNAYNDVVNAAEILYGYVTELLDSNYMQTNETTAFMHCIGHSLGAHICGIFGKKLYRSKYLKVRRITGLDPAGPSFKKEPFYKRLDDTDALFVDVIHTSSNLGIFNPIGHANFYPNGGKSQNCKLCSHSIAHEYFTASIYKCSNDSFLSHNCQSFNDYLEGKCTKK